MIDHESAVRRLRAANPVPTLDGLHAEDLAAVRALLERRRGRMATTSVAAPPRQAWRRPVFTLAAAFVLTLAGVGTWLLLTRGGEEAPPITTVTTSPAPTTTLPVTTTSPATTTTEATSAASWSYPAEAVPPFHATIAWDRNPESTWRIVYQGSTALVDVWYEAPLRFRWQLIELDTDLVAQGVPGAGQHMGGPGSYIVADGETMGHYWADGAWGQGDASEYLAWMFWEPQSPGGLFDWAGQCADESSSPTTETVAGRDTYHIACSTVRGDWELWVDEQTGLILKMRGETEIDDRLLGTSPEGGFEVTLIEFLEAPIPGGDTLFDVPEGTPGPGEPTRPDIDEVPPLHAVIYYETAEDYGDGPRPGSRTEEIWHQDPQTGRSEILETSGDAPWGPPGTFAVTAGGLCVRFEPMTDDGFANAYRVDEDCTSSPAEAFLPRSYEMDEPWSEVGVESVAGRPARHLSRFYQDGSTTLTDGLWIDIETDLVLRRATERAEGGVVTRVSQTVLSIEFDPDFPEGIFAFAPEPDWCNLTDWSNCVRSDIWAGTRLSQDEEVPTFSGPLADGTPFDLADLRGGPVVVFFWLDGFRAGLLEQWLADFEALYQEWGDRVAFVSVPEMDVTEARRFVERVPLTHAVVACYDDSVFAAQQTNVVCIPDSAPYLWGTGWPAWVMVDAEGRALDILRGGNEYSYEALNSMIAAAVGG